MKLRKLGIRIKHLPPADFHSAIGMVAMYDVETGENFEGVTDVSLIYDINAVVSATITVNIAAVELLDA